MTPRHLTLVTFLMLTALIVVGQLYLTIPLSEDIAELFRTDLSAAAWAGTAFGLAYAAGFLVWGPLSDRFGRRIILLCGLVATTMATALLGAAGSIGWFLAGRALQGFVASSFPPVALSLVAEALPPERRPLGVSLISFAFLAAAPVAQFAGVSVAASPTGLMLGLAPLYLVMAAGLALALPRGAGSAVGGTDPAEGRMASLLANPVVVTGWLAALTVLFGFVSFQGGDRDGGRGRIRSADRSSRRASSPGPEPGRGTPVKALGCACHSTHRAVHLRNRVDPGRCGRCADGGRVRARVGRRGPGRARADRDPGWGGLRSQSRAGPVRLHLLAFRRRERGLARGDGPGPGGTGASLRHPCRTSRCRCRRHHPRARPPARGPSHAGNLTHFEEGTAP
ncbi:hypothetical protein Salmuc_02895 [Salipiger mucosus DSM 16094]|uniref:Major facilitator superfamily (MFS) profile domain-containing protein n=1 Tax=Salipiger mucosus DSM 16094 TaxID=1123237 RepID=S9Q9S5_9RHOB|nr:hypothetical protein Salmuc_02895 [Salipiger mucosus DSM 16094]